MRTTLLPVIRRLAAAAAAPSRHLHATAVAAAKGAAIAMPALSPTMTAGRVAAWKKKPGDSFAPGDVLVRGPFEPRLMPRLPRMPFGFWLHYGWRHARRFRPRAHAV